MAGTLSADECCEAGGYGGDADAAVIFTRFSKAPKGNGIGATGSKNLRAYWNPCFSLLGMVLRTWVWFHTYTYIGDGVSPGGACAVPHGLLPSGPAWRARAH